MRGVRPLALALASYFAVIQLYTSLASLAPTPPVGYVFATLPVAAALVAVLAAATLVALARLVRDRARPAGTSAALLGAWLGAAAFSSALGLDPASGFQVVGIMTMGAVFHLALVRYFREPGVAPLLLAAYLGGGCAASAAGLVMVALRRPAALWALNHGRAAGVFVTANQFAAFAIAFIFVAAGVALGGGPLRRLALASVALGSAALVATVSQAGWLGAAAGAAFLGVALGARRTAAVAAAAALVLGAAFALRPSAGHNPAEAFDRLRIWQAGVRVATLFPLTGVGPMAYWRVYPAIRPANGDAPGTFGALHPHDAYLSLAGETGLVGLAACGYGWWRFARTMRLRLAAAPGAERSLAAGVCAALVAVLVQGVFDTIGVVEMAFVWIPYTALALAAAGDGAPA